MKLRYTLFKRGRVFYWRGYANRETVQPPHPRLGEAQTLLHSRNEATRQAHLNLRIAQTYLAASDPIFASRTWQTVMDTSSPGPKQGKTRIRCERAAMEKPFDLIRGHRSSRPAPNNSSASCRPGPFRRTSGLRRYHNFALDLNWLPYPVVPGASGARLGTREAGDHPYKELFAAAAGNDLTWQLLRHAGRGELTEFRVDQREQLLGGLWGRPARTRWSATVTALTAGLIFGRLKTRPNCKERK